MSLGVNMLDCQLSASRSSSGCLHAAQFARAAPHQPGLYRRWDTPRIQRISNLTERARTGFLCLVLRVLFAAVRRPHQPLTKSPIGVPVYRYWVARFALKSKLTQPAFTGENLAIRFDIWLRRRQVTSPKASRP